MSQATQLRGESSAIEAVRGKIAAIGPNFDPDILAATRALYAPLVPKPSGQVKVTADVAYGADARQKLDVYQPARPNGSVLVYIPGGGFVGGDKNEGAFYGNLGHYFAGHGVLTIAANYRLAPTHAYPAGSQDVGGAVAWARANAAKYGGNADRIVLFGQSAGATHSAGYVFDPQFHPASGVGIKACILMSGPYKVTAPARGSMPLYFGDDASKYAARSPLTHVGKSRVPLMLSVAEYDPVFLTVPTYELAQAVTERDGKGPRMAYFAGHNHVSTVMSFGTEQDDVAAAVRDYISSVA